MAESKSVKVRLRKNDIVVVTLGKDRGKKGKILKVLRDKNQVIVEGVNFIKKHVRPSRQHRHGGILEMEGPIHISNVRLYCPKCDKGVRFGAAFLEDGKKVRVCKKCGEVLDKS